MLAPEAELSGSYVFDRGWYRRLARVAQLAFDPDVTIECAP